MNNTNTIIIFLGCIIGIILFGKMLILPIKIIVKLIINTILGGLIIAGINWLGSSFALNIGLNVFTAIFVRNSWSPGGDTTFDI